jgi:hypothetical protein
MTVLTCEILASPAAGVIVAKVKREEVTYVGE